MDVSLSLREKFVRIRDFDAPIPVDNAVRDWGY
jgi:hypothetical protein